MELISLVTTSLKETWTSKKKIILGNWCYSNDIDHGDLDRLEKEKSEQILKIEYHWDNREKFKNDYERSFIIYEKLISKLSIKLNKYHKTNYTESFWEIIIGNTVLKIIQVLIDRYNSIHTTLKTIDSAKTINLNFNYEHFIANDSKELYYLVNSDEWNHFIYIELIKFLDKSNKIKIINNTIKIEKSNFSNNYNLGIEKDYIFKKLAKIILKKLRKYVIKINKVIFFKPSISPVVQWASEIKLFQIPSLLLFDYSHKRNSYIDNNFRESKIQSENKNKIEEFIFNYIARLLPKTFIEDFKYLDLESSKLVSNSKKIIFTATGYHFNDLFKLYVAKAKANGSKYVIYQHGGVFGVAEFSSIERLERRIADKFVTWGWKDSNVISNLIYEKNIIDNYSNKESRKKIVLVLLSNPKYTHFLDSTIVGSQITKYFSEMNQFLNLFDNDILSNVYVRANKNSWGWNFVDTLKRNFNEIKFDDTNTSFLKSISSAKIVISTYNSTTVCELLGYNVPTILLWNKNDWPLRKDAKPIYDKLYNAKILHYDNVSAYNHLLDIQHDVNDWWYKMETQEAVSEFANKYSNGHISNAKQLNKIIKRI
tara:strand:- start:4016 stop:5803 length:1788 start_codon:yes stop_codon:yes gene_type:complete